MRRFASRSPWCLLAGVITTIAIAWSCAMWSTVTLQTDQFLHSIASANGETQSWTWNERPGFGVKWVWIQAGVFRSEPPDPRTAPPRWVQLPDEKIMLIRYLASGWPFTCMNARLIERSKVKVSGVRVAGARQTTLPWDYAYVIKPATAIDPFTAKILPLNLHAPELIANSMFWGGVWFLLVFIPGKVRGLIRRREGLCPSCRYDLRSLSGSCCPECGTTITTATARSPNRLEAAPRS